MFKTTGTGMKRITILTGPDGEQVVIRPYNPTIPAALIPRSCQVLAALSSTTTVNQFDAMMFAPTVLRA